MERRGSLILPIFKQRIEDNLIGVDIGSDSVKLLSINSTVKPFQVKNFAISSLPAGAFVKGEIKDPTAIGTHLRELFKTHRIESKSVALAIPRSSVIIKKINVDKRLNHAPGLKPIITFLIWLVKFIWISLSHLQNKTPASSI